MGKTLNEIVADVRLDLHDTDSTAYRWPDAVLQRCVERARARLQEVLPRERTADLTATAGTRAYGLGGIGDLLWVERVQFDALGHRWPPLWTPFEVWAGTLTLLLAVPPAGGETARLYYAGAQVVDGTGNTFPPEAEHRLAVGAAVYAALEAGVGALGRFGASERTPDQWRAWLEERLAAWDAALTALRQTTATRGLPYAGGWAI